MRNASQSRTSKLIDSLEETIIALLLGVMTLITFANVIARYFFNDNILWALEATVFLFAWLVLLGASYGVKKSIHNGVDVLVNALPLKIRQIALLFSVFACLAFSILLLKAGWDYWFTFITKRSFLETNDVPMPEFLQFISIWMNDGEEYEKLPRFIPYAVLPLSMALPTYRYLQVFWQILTGKKHELIASHETEELLESQEDRGEV